MFNEFISDLKNQPLSSILAILVTAMGGAILFVVMNVFAFDYSIDRFHPQHERMYRLETHFHLPTGDIIPSAMAPLPMFEVLNNDPRVDDVVFAQRMRVSINSGRSTQPNVPLFALSEGFLSILNPFASATPLPPLGTNEIYITPEFNNRFLHLDQPEGKSIEIEGKGKFVIKNVLPLRANTALEFHAVMPFYPHWQGEMQEARENWYDSHVYTFFITVDGAALDSAALDQVVAERAPPIPGAPFKPEDFIKLSSRSIIDIHYDNSFTDDLNTRISPMLLNLLLTVGSLLVLTTVFNFLNINGVILGTKKVTLGVKKALGASNADIIVESLSVAMLQIVAILLLSAIALLAMALSFPLAADFLQGLPLSAFLTTSTAMAILTILVVIASHAFYLVFFVLRESVFGGGVSRYENFGTYVLNKFSVVLQLVISGIAIYVGAGMATQSSFLDQADFGYDKSHVSVIEFENSFSSVSDVRFIESLLNERIGSSRIALSSWMPFVEPSTVITLSASNQSMEEQFSSVNVVYADKNFLDVWGINTIAGETNALAASQRRLREHAVVTQSFVEEQDSIDLANAVGSVFYRSENDTTFEIEIVKVVDDFTLGDVTAVGGSFIILIDSGRLRYGALRTSGIDDLAIIESTLESEGYTASRIVDVQQLHRDHFNERTLLLKAVLMVAATCLVLTLLSTLVVGISEIKHLSKTLGIMEAVGGSIYTSLVYFLKANVVPVLVAVGTAFVVGRQLLSRWLSQFEFNASLSYTYAFAALLFLTLCVIVVLCISLLYAREDFKITQAQEG